MKSSHESRLLTGPDAGNPLGFLTALGTLRVATLVWPQRQVRMGWERHGTGWRPRLLVDAALEEETLINGIYGYCRHGTGGDGVKNGAKDPDATFPYFAFERDTSSLTPERFAALACEARRTVSPGDRAFADFLVAFGCEACLDDEYIEDTALRTMSGTGHQHFLATMLKLAGAVRPQHIRAALLEPWRYADPMRGLSMRWDPHDDRRYALQWQDPSKDPDRGRRGSMLGANRLAVEALPLLPTVPILRGGRARLATTGFDTAREPCWTWPVWGEPISLEVCASLLANPLLQELSNNSGDSPRRLLRHMGIEEVFCSRRITVGYYRNFTPARAV